MSACSDSLKALVEFNKARRAKMMADSKFSQHLHDIVNPPPPPPEDGFAKTERRFNMLMDAAHSAGRIGTKGLIFSGAVFGGPVAVMAKSNSGS